MMIRSMDAKSGNGGKRRTDFAEKGPLADQPKSWYAKRKQRRLDEAFFMAVKAGGIREMYKLLVEGANVDARDDNGQTALMLAAHLGWTPVVERLIRAGADVNAQDDMGGTALMSAVDRSHGTIAKMLIRNGAKVKVRDSETACTIRIAKRSGDREMAKILETHEG